MSCLFGLIRKPFANNAGLTYDPTVSFCSTSCEKVTCDFVFVDFLFNYNVVYVHPTVLSEVQ